MVTKELERERKKVNINPSEAQKKSGNYAMGHININGFQITIENPKGSYRRGKDKDGTEWKTYMHNDYGYFTKTVGKDGDAIDVFIGPNMNSTKIFAIDQKFGNKFDETKVMLCFSNAEQAKKAYLSNYEKDWKGFWKITETDIDTFKEWLYDGHRQYKPFFQYKEFKLNESKMNNKIRINEDTLSSIIKEAIQNELGQPSDIMDALIMIKEAYVDIQDVLKNNKQLMYDLSPAMGNLRGAIKILNELSVKKY